MALFCVASATFLLAWHFGRSRAAGLSSGAAGSKPGRGELVGAAATLAAALIAVPFTWYSAVYLPGTATPAVSIKTELTDVSEHVSHGAVTVKMTVENTSKTSVRLIGSQYVLAGARVLASNSVGEQLDATKVHAATEYNYGPGARYNASTRLSPTSLIQFGPLTWDQASLEPGESTEVSVVAFFPAGSFDLLRVGADVTIAHDDRIGVEPFHPGTAAPVQEHGMGTPCAGRRVLVQSWPVEHGSAVEALTQDRREVVLGRVIDDSAEQQGAWWPTVPYLIYQVQRRDLHSCGNLFEEPGSLENASMAGVAGAMAEILVPENLAAPPAR
ncbi:hypothetical protein AB0F81_50270 [Actinoplanes sp. NPDC024001]|uniref:hypothetical protein n=1 Tax=Actinoplanes sp. NPDC024001 TaxID=3154598 RepID=UPI0033C7856C